LSGRSSLRAPTLRTPCAAARAHHINSHKEPQHAVDSRARAHRCRHQDETANRILSVQCLGEVDPRPALLVSHKAPIR
jgi:hypothetical protein